MSNPSPKYTVATESQFPGSITASAVLPTVPVPPIKAVNMRILSASNGMIIELYPQANDSPQYRTPMVIRVVEDPGRLGEEVIAAMIEAKMMEVNT